MAFKRLIAVLCVKNDMVVKSYGYNCWRPAGKLIPALRNLDRWRVDEILVLDISRSGSLNWAILSAIRDSKISTPVIFGGGIRTREDALKVIASGCDRIVVETLLFKEPDVIDSIANTIGIQAIIGSLPISTNNGQVRSSLSHIDGIPSKWRDIHTIEEIWEFYYAMPISEILAIDAVNEGSQGFFSLTTTDSIKEILRSYQHKSVIWFGGIDDSIGRDLLLLPSTVGIALGNMNFEREVSFFHNRHELSKGRFNSWIRRIKK
jgi:cyclase